MAALALGATVVGAGVGAGVGTGAAAGAFDGEDAALPPVFSPPPAGADEASPAPDGEDPSDEVEDAEDAPSSFMPLR